MLANYLKYSFSVFNLIKVAVYDSPCSVSPLKHFSCVSQAKGVFEKVGEATETALTVLVEKMNVNALDKAGLKPKELSTLCNQHLSSMWKKDFTLEFSRDRKSMSSYCIPIKPTKLGPGAKQFVKVCTRNDISFLDRAYVAP